MTSRLMFRTNWRNEAAEDFPFWIKVGGPTAACSKLLPFVMCPDCETIYYRLVVIHWTGHYLFHFSQISHGRCQLSSTDRITWRTRHINRCVHLFLAGFIAFRWLLNYQHPLIEVKYEFVLFLCFILTFSNAGLSIACLCFLGAGSIISVCFYWQSSFVIWLIDLKSVGLYNFASDACLEFGNESICSNLADASLWQQSKIVMNLRCFIKTDVAWNIWKVVLSLKIYTSTSRILARNPFQNISDVILCNWIATWLNTLEAFQAIFKSCCYYCDIWVTFETEILLVNWVETLIEIPILSAVTSAFVIGIVLPIIAGRKLARVCPARWGITESTSKGRCHTCLGFLIKPKVNWLLHRDQDFFPRLRY